MLDSSVGYDRIMNFRGRWILRGGGLALVEEQDSQGQWRGKVLMDGQIIAHLWNPNGLSPVTSLMDLLEAPRPCKIVDRDWEPLLAKAS